MTAIAKSAKTHPAARKCCGWEEPAICPFHHYIGTFWYLVSKQFHDHPVVIHLERLLRCKSVKIWKKNWKFKYSKSQNCFANISVKKARMFMKFYMVVKYSCQDCVSELWFLKLLHYLEEERILLPNIGPKHTRSKNTWKSKMPLKTKSVPYEPKYSPGKKR